MKNILLLLTLSSFFLYSCEKESNRNPGDPQLSANGSIEYKVNGSPVKMDNVNLLSGQYVLFQKQLKGSIFPATRYSLSAQNGPNNAISFVVVTDSLRQINYHYDSASARNNSTFAFFFTYTNAEQATLFSTGDYVDVNITSYENSRITGTFTAQYTPLSVSSGVGQPGSVIISEGKINNVQVVY